MILWFNFVIFICTYKLISSERTKIHTKVYCPTQPICSSYYNFTGYANLVHSIAEGVHDDLHYIVSTIGQPSVLVARTPKHTQLNLNLKSFLSKDVKSTKESVKFSSKPYYVYGMLLNKIYEFNDINDTANILSIKNNNSLWKIYETDSFDWMVTYQNGSVQHNNLRFMSKTYRGVNDFFQNNGSFDLSFSVFGKSGRNSLLPHLQTTPNNSHFDISLNNFRPQYPSSRYAIELLFLNSGDNSTQSTIVGTKSIDDEYTPGVFELTDWTTNHRSENSYLQWKPVCYTMPMRSIGSLTRAKYYTPKQFTAHGLPTRRSLLYAYYGDSLFSNHLQTTFANISFGLSQDNFYKKTNFTAWTVSLGYGNPPPDTVSITIILVISIGFCLPVVILIFGGIGIFFKKLLSRQKRDSLLSSTYERIQ